ncbi:MAG: M28 family peptidase [Chitinophagaceae bacterium]|nr:M28 family peptidase [Chitinophagaceae bacterium]
MKKFFFIPFCLVTLAVAAQNNKDASKFASTITQKDLKDQLTIVAADDMEGRETASLGQKKAAAYIEDQFKKIGLKPGNGNSYQQLYPVYQDELKSASLSLYNINFDVNKHFTANLSSSVNGGWAIKNVVYVAYGMSDKERDDYKDVDVKGKWVMLLDISPADMEKGESFIPGPSRFGLSGKIRTAMQKGAVGVLAVSKSFMKENQPTPSTLGNMYMKKEGSGSGASNAIPVLSISYQAAASVLTKNITSYTELKNLPIGAYATDGQVRIVKETNQLESSNVIGVLEGTDKKEEYVVLTAHYDHLGKRGDVVFNGADDDGSGTVSVIEMAEAFAEAKKKGKGPRRTIVFMTVSGEEKGLWGSEYYGDNPIYSLEKTTVNLNTDMVGRIDPSYKGDSLNYVFVIGEDKLSSDLLKITDSINTHFKMELDRRYNDPKDPNRFYYRSDHYNFAKKGVPIIFYFNGVHKDYHRESDTVEKINFDVMEKRVRLIFTTAWVMANRENMLKRDLPLNMPGR